jgi:hypothetical protein
MADTLLAPEPAAPAAPAPPPMPDVPQASSNPNIEEAFSDLDQFSTTPEEAAKPADQQPPAPVRGADGKFQKKDATPPATPEPPKPPEKKPDETPKPPEVKAPETPKPPDKPDVKPPVTAPELRKAYETIKAEHATLKKEFENFKTAAATPKEDPEKKALQEKLSATEKRLGELDETLRFTNYERSQEFKDKYQKPFEDAYVAGRRKVATLDIEERAIEVEDPATGEKTKKVIQEARPATEADFDRLMSVTDDREARKMAKQMFGADAPIAMAMREKVTELNQAGHAALEDYKKNGAAREKQAQELTTKQKAEINSAWTQLNKSIIEKYPHLFAPVEGDDEGNELLQKGFAFVDRAFGEEAMKLSPQELVKIHSQIRNRAAAFGRQVYVNKKQAARIKELEGQIKALEESGPGAGEGGRPKPSDEEAGKYGEAALDRYAQPAA